MKLDFIIDNATFIAHTLAGMNSFSSDDGRSDVVAFQNYAWEVSSELYNVLARPIYAEKLIVDYGSLLSYWKNFDWNELDEYLMNLVKSQEYKTIYRQTQEYLSFCSMQWNNNYRVTSRIIHDLTGLPLRDKFTIYITHPCQRNGTSYGNMKIGWGHKEEWPNYTTIYLWHEILHQYLGSDDIEHAIIQLVADEELPVRLNGGSYPPFVGHEYLVPVMEKILPEWKDYMKRESRDIQKFILQVKEALHNKD